MKPDAVQRRLMGKILSRFEEKGLQIVAVKLMQIDEELAKQVEEALETAQSTGKVAKGTNEVTKFIERGDAALVVIAEDVDPAEIVAHIPVLADEKEIPYVYLPTKEQVGVAAGLTVGTASACIVDAGDAEAAVAEIVEKVAELKE